MVACILEGILCTRFAQNLMGLLVPLEGGIFLSYGRQSFWRIGQAELLGAQLVPALVVIR